MSGPALGLPGLAGAEHIGLTVPDFDAAVAFFVDVIGCEFVIDAGWSGDRDLMSRQLGVEPDARYRWGFVRCGNGPNLEIFQYRANGQRTAVPRNSDVGAAHVAFYVDDMDLAVAHLRRHGVTILGDVQRIVEGPAAGSLWVYFSAPWGLQLELVSYPGGKGPEGSPARRLWRPQPSAARGP